MIPTVLALSALCFFGVATLALLGQFLVDTYDKNAPFYLILAATAGTAAGYVGWSHWDELVTWAYQNSLFYPNSNQ